MLQQESTLVALPDPQDPQVPDDPDRQTHPAHQYS
nr:MAG TPA: hypothetical protein [Herelleviridae sp.]